MFGILGAMPMLTILLLLLTLLLCGAYAGMILMCQIGVLPAMRLLRLHAYADAWRAMDSFMDRLMPPYKISLLVVNAAATILVAVQHRWPLVVATGLSLLLSVGGLVLTVRQQLPLNAKLKGMGAEASEEVLREIRDGTVRGFRTRFVLAAAAFLSLSVGVLVWPVR